MADQTGKSDNNPKKPISEEEYKKGLISDIRPIQARPEKKDPLENLTGNSGDFADTEDIEDEEDQEIIDDESSEEEQDDQPELSRDDIERLTKDQRIKETPEQQLEKNKVPEYKAEPPEAYKQPPGGPAIKPKAPTGTTAKAGQGVAKTGRGAAQAAQKTGQAIAKAGQAIAKAVQAAVAAIRTAVAAIAALFETAPVWVPIVLIILFILIIVGGIVIFLKARQTPNANGASPTVAADVINDRPWISKIMALSGDANIATQLTDEVLRGLSADLDNVLSGLNSSSDIDQQTKDRAVAKIAEIQTLITNFQSLPPADSGRTETGKKIVSEVAKLLNIFAEAPFHYSGETARPIATEKITGYNETLHGGTPRRRAPKEGHGVFIGNNGKWNDASDIAAPGGTTVVYAVFDATVDEIRDRYGKVILATGIDSEGKKWQVVYGHLQPGSLKNKDGGSLRAGQEIKAGTEIGRLYSGLNSPHLHFELVCNGRSVVTTPSDISDCKYSGGRCASGAKYTLIGKYLYLRQLSALNKTLK
jgi:murein DD-endopeptidase MepM/ murein hydrolase activator NlpD